MSGYWGGWTNEQTYRLITMALGIRTIFYQIKAAIPFTSESAHKMCDEVFQMPDSMMEGVVWQRRGRTTGINSGRQTMYPNEDRLSHEATALGRKLDKRREALQEDILEFIAEGDYDGPVTNRLREYLRWLRIEHDSWGYSDRDQVEELDTGKSRVAFCMIDIDKETFHD